MRSEAAILLDELAGLANDSWEAYAQTARGAPPGELAVLLAAQAEQRRRMALALEDEVRRLGERPRDRDTNPGIAHRLFARLKGGFAGDRPRALVEECERAEAELAEQIAAALPRLPPDAAATATRWHAEVIAALGRLAAIRVRLRDPRREG